MIIDSTHTPSLNTPHSLKESFSLSEHSMPLFIGVTVLVATAATGYCIRYSDWSHCKSMRDSISSNGLVKKIKEYFGYDPVNQQKKAEEYYTMGMKHLRGQDLEKAVYWFEKSAEGENTRAQYYLGHSYYHGHGVKKDLKEAMRWIKKSAEGEDADAQLLLGIIMYGKGEGVEKDLKKAAYWIEKAAQQEHVGGQLELGMRYYNGQGVEKDVEKAMQWIRKAALRGSPDAQLALTNLQKLAQDQTESNPASFPKP